MKTIKAVGPINLFIIIISTFFSACNDDITKSGGGDYYEIKSWEYSDNHYFLDTIYKQSYFDFYNNLVLSQQTNTLAVDEQSFEVWVETDVTTLDYRKAALHIDLPVLPSNGVYNDSFKVVKNLQQGISAIGYVRKLLQNEYVFNRQAGYVSLKTNLPDNYFAGVAYKRTLTGEQFGTLSTNVYASDTLVLKMIKVQNLIPQNIIAWEMKLRNIYQLPKTNIDPNKFELNVMHVVNGIYIFTLPNYNSYLITILGLDKYTNGRTGPPDNKFDYIPGITINPENGWIIFPTLKPFLTNLSQYNLNGQTIDSSYWYPEIYTELKQNASNLPNANRYVLTGYTK